MPLAVDGSKKTFRYKCACCGQIHEGGPSFAYDQPVFAAGVPAEERAKRVWLGSDLCVVDEEFHFIRTTLEIPIIGTDDGFLWGVWVSQSKDSFERYIETFDQDQTGMNSFGWLAVNLPGYHTHGEDLVSLPTDVVWGPERPQLRIHDDQNHPLAIDQRQGISWDRAVELAVLQMH
jgi:hypothetical protein